MSVKMPGRISGTCKYSVNISFYCHKYCGMHKKSSQCCIGEEALKAIGCNVCMSVAQLCSILATPWTSAHQAPPSMEFSRREYRSR